MTEDSRIGMIYEQTNATDYLALETAGLTDKTKDKFIKMYSNILVYKVLLEGTISYVHESNIRDIVCKEKKN